MNPNTPAAGPEGAGGAAPTRAQLRTMFPCPSCRQREKCRAYASGKPVADHPAREAVFDAYLRGLADARQERAHLG